LFECVFGCSGGLWGYFIVVLCFQFHVFIFIIFKQCFEFIIQWANIAARLY